MKAVGDRLRLIRLAYGVLHGRKKPLGQSEFARLCGIKPGTWNNYNYETGDNCISIDNAAAVRRQTGATLDYIYLDDRSALPYALALEIERMTAQKVPKRP